MYRRNIKFRKCLKCKKTFEQQIGTLAMKYIQTACPYCGGKTEIDDDMNNAHRKVIKQRMNNLYKNANSLTKI